MFPVFLGAGRDAPLIDQVTSLCSCPFLSLAGKASLRQSAAVLERAALVVGIDTGLIHAAVALGRPTVAVFGPMGLDHEPRGPLQETVRADCQFHPCRWNRKGCPADSEYQCIRGVRPEQVLAAAKRVLLAAGNGTPTRSHPT
jgi:ADP-heptose:LPS heptosyltransferase